VQGGCSGAIIGGIVGGGRGAGTGAAIGIITGAAEADANARAAMMVRIMRRLPPGGSDLVCNIQLSLARLGYDPSPPRRPLWCTVDAISQYQHANRLPVDGQPSPQLLNMGGET
jgi:peptidoglycan hydrolase-like protein with peptidoglycan-binding domain